MRLSRDGVLCEDRRQVIVWRQAGADPFRPGGTQALRQRGLVEEPA
jgi:hypothetical protein